MPDQERDCCIHSRFNVLNTINRDIAFYVSIFMEKSISDGKI